MNSSRNQRGKPDRPVLGSGVFVHENLRGKGLFPLMTGNNTQPKSEVGLAAKNIYPTPHRMCPCATILSNPSVRLRSLGRKELLAMRRLITLVLALFILGAGSAPAVAQAPAPQRQVQTKEQTVYITKTGKKYHRANCRYLSRSKIPVTLKDAKANGYSACSVCNPPK